jgi:hypothetical protein
MLSNRYPSVEESLKSLSKKWKIAPYDLHLNKRDDVVDTTVNVKGVVFHIPALTKDNLYVIWKCLWPDCHNCCERQERIPLTCDDIVILLFSHCIMHDEKYLVESLSSIASFKDLIMDGLWQRCIISVLHICLTTLATFSMLLKSSSLKLISIQCLHSTIYKLRNHNTKLRAAMRWV